MRIRVHRAAFIYLALFTMAILVAAPAGAYWHATGFGAGFGTTSTLVAPTAVTVPATSTATVAVSWTASTGSPTPTGYFVVRTTAGTSTPACASSLTTLVTGTSCSDTAVPDATYTYVVTAVYRSWTAASTASSSVIVLSATHLTFSVQPSNAASTVAITPSVQVRLLSAAGGNVLVANVSITVAIGTNPGAGVLTGTATALTNASGVATFAGLSIDKAAVGYTLTASSTGLTGATSSTFTITVGVATQLAFITSPTDSFAGWPFNSQPVVVVEDAGGNPETTNGAAVTMALTTAGTSTLTCVPNTDVAADVAGVATFSGCSIDKVGTYTLTASSGALTAAISSSFNVVAAPTHLAWNNWTPAGCNTPPSGTSFALHFDCGLLGGGMFTSYVSLSDSSHNVLTNLGPAITVTLAAVHGSVSPTTITIAHGQQQSSSTSTFTPSYVLLVQTTDTVTASDPTAPTSLISATAALHTLL